MHDTEIDGRSWCFESPEAQAMADRSQGPEIRLQVLSHNLQQGEAYGLKSRVDALRTYQSQLLWPWTLNSF